MSFSSTTKPTAYVGIKMSGKQADTLKEEKTAP